VDLASVQPDWADDGVQHNVKAACDVMRLVATWDPMWLAAACTGGEAVDSAHDMPRGWREAQHLAANANHIYVVLLLTVCY
jgi:hypothetical protein